MQRKRIIKFENVIKDMITNKKYVRVLDDVTFEVFEGDFVVIHAGDELTKTTVFRLLGGMDSSTYGDIWIDDGILTKSNKRELLHYRQNVVGLIFGGNNLLRSLNLRQNLMVVSKLAEKPLDIERILSSMYLDNKADLLVSQLTFREQSMGALARALVKNPLFLLCDEPANEEDKSSIKDYFRILQNINRALKRTVVLVTDKQIITRIADKVISIKNGKIKSLVENLEPEDIERIEI